MYFSKAGAMPFKHNILNAVCLSRVGGRTRPSARQVIPSSRQTASCIFRSFTKVLQGTPEPVHLCHATVRETPDLRYIRNIEAQATPGSVGELSRYETVEVLAREIEAVKLYE